MTLHSCFWSMGLINIYIYRLYISWTINIWLFCDYKHNITDNSTSSYFTMRWRSSNFYISRFNKKKLYLISLSFSINMIFLLKYDCDIIACLLQSPLGMLYLSVYKLMTCGPTLSFYFFIMLWELFR